MDWGFGDVPDRMDGSGGSTDEQAVAASVNARNSPAAIRVDFILLIIKRDCSLCGYGKSKNNLAKSKAIVRINNVDRKELFQIESRRME